MMKKVFFFLLFLLFSVVAFSQPLQGFFLKAWKEKKEEMPLSEKKAAIKEKHTVLIKVNTAKTATRVSPFLYGNNTNQWMGQVVTESVLVKQVKKLSPNILRYPGGNFSNIFFWNAEQNKKPVDVPDTILYGDNRLLRKSRFSYGMSNDEKGLSLDNYYKLLEQTGSEGTICVNAGYARYGLSEKPVATAAHYAADWVRYDKGRTRFWEIGNEDYGEWQAGYKIDVTKNKDGQPEIISGEQYGKIFREFADSMRQAAKEINAIIYIGTTIVEANDHREIKKNWNNGFFKSAGNAADFFVVHSYYTPYEQNSGAETILNTAVAVTDSMMSHIQQMCRENDIAMKPVALTEWNIFAVRSKQQTSFINGMHAALVMGEMAKQQYGMACRWDLANAYADGDDHGLFNKGDEPGMPKWSARPAYYYLYYFQRFFGDRLLASSSTDSSVVTFASSFSDGKKGLVLVNTSAEKKVAMLQIPGKSSSSACVYSLTGGTDNGSFSQKLFINEKGPQLPAGGPEMFEEIKAWKYTFNNKMKLALPARSVQYILID